MEQFWVADIAIDEMEYKVIKGDYIHLDDGAVRLEFAFPFFDDQL